MERRFQRRGERRGGKEDGHGLFGPFCQTVMDGRRWEIDKNPSKKETNTKLAQKKKRVRERD
jgi:hypothetical protein